LCCLLLRILCLGYLICAEFVCFCNYLSAVLFLALVLVLYLSLKSDLLVIVCGFVVVCGCKLVCLVSHVGVVLEFLLYCCRSSVSVRCIGGFCRVGFGGLVWMILVRVFGCVVYFVSVV